MNLESWIFQRRTGLPPRQSWKRTENDKAPVKLAKEISMRERVSRRNTYPVFCNKQANSTVESEIKNIFISLQSDENLLSEKGVACVESRVILSTLAGLFLLSAILQPMFVIELNWELPILINYYHTTKTQIATMIASSCNSVGLLSFWILCRMCASSWLPTRVRNGWCRGVFH